MIAKIQNFFHGAFGCVWLIIMMIWAFAVMSASMTHAIWLFERVVPTPLAIILGWFLFPITLSLGPIIGIFRGDWYPAALMYSFPVIVTIMAVIYSLFNKSSKQS